MNTGRFIHQQVMQLKWYWVAGLGLIMVLPLEEAVVNLKAGEGFYSQEMTVVAILLAPLLAALLACANVQADLDVRRESFWLSKPVTVSRFLMGKFFVGLLLVLVTLACPMLFSGLTTAVHGTCWQGFFPIFMLVATLSLLAYSVCFFCNVLIRQTARAWLIGMTLVAFTCLVPWILPFDFTDVSDVFMAGWLLGSYLIIALGLSGLCFWGATWAVQHNWRLHTNLKGLLWSGACFVFIMVMLFSRQIANLKIVDEAQFTMADDSLHTSFDDYQGQLIIGGDPHSYEIHTQEGKLEVQEVVVDFETIRQRGPVYTSPPYEVPEGLKLTMRGGGMVSDYGAEGEMHFLQLRAYYRPVQKVDKDGKTHQQESYQRAYLHWDRIVDRKRETLGVLDLSEFVQNDRWIRFQLYFVRGHKAVALLNGDFLAIDIVSPDQMKILETKHLGNLRSWIYSLDQLENGFFRLLPLETIDIQDRIRISLELILHKSLLIETPNAPLQYVLVSDDKVARYEVASWDENTLTCRLNDQRSSALLGKILNPRIYREGGDYYMQRGDYTVKDGTLYAWEGNRVRVFDVAGPRIRKLGHLERLSKKEKIEAMRVLDNGDILLMYLRSEGTRDERVHHVRIQRLKNPG